MMGSRRANFICSSSMIRRLQYTTYQVDGCFENAVDDVTNALLSTRPTLPGCWREDAKSAPWFQTWEGGQWTSGLCPCTRTFLLSAPKRSLRRRGASCDSAHTHSACTAEWRVFVRGLSLPGAARRKLTLTPRCCRLLFVMSLLRHGSVAMLEQPCCDLSRLLDS